MPYQKKFKHCPIITPEPRWGSTLAAHIIELEQLRERRFIPYSPDVFLDLKVVFDQLENWASARIEGNQTRLIDALDPGVKSEVTQTTGYQELQNLDEAIKFIDKYCKDHNELSKAFVLEVHKIVTQGLPIGMDQPGDETPGKFRVKDVEITKSTHVPPLGVKVEEYMEEFVKFANKDDGKQYYLLKLAMLHHRFTWIHPFGNGNGRMARLLTYASLQIMGYGTSKWRIINPAIIFYSDRQLYYDKLRQADQATQEGLLEWAEYFLEGLLRETNKIDRLSDASYVVDSIIKPVLKEALDTSRIGAQEYTILRASISMENMNFASKDLETMLNERKSPVARSRIIASLKQSGLIRPIWNNKQRYALRLVNPLLMRHLIDVLEREGFVREDRSATT